MAAACFTEPCTPPVFALTTRTTTVARGPNGVVDFAYSSSDATVSANVTLWEVSPAGMPVGDRVGAWLVNGTSVSSTVPTLGIRWPVGMNSTGLFAFALDTSADVGIAMNSMPVRSAAFSVVFPMLGFNLTAPAAAVWVPLNVSAKLSLSWLAVNFTGYEMIRARLEGLPMGMPPVYLSGPVPVMSGMVNATVPWGVAPGLYGVVLEGASAELLGWRSREFPRLVNISAPPSGSSSGSGNGSTVGPAPTLVIIRPVPGASWAVGTNVTVYWTSTGLDCSTGANASLLTASAMMSAGNLMTLVERVAACTPTSGGSGTTVFTVPATFTAGSVVTFNLRVAAGMGYPLSASPVQQVMIIPGPTTNSSSNATSGGSGPSNGAAMITIIEPPGPSQGTINATYNVTWAASGLDCKAVGGSRVGVSLVRAASNTFGSTLPPLTLWLALDAPACSAANPTMGWATVTIPPLASPGNFTLRVNVTAGLGLGANHWVGPLTFAPPFTFMFTQPAPSSAGGMAWVAGANVTVAWMVADLPCAGATVALELRDPMTTVRFPLTRNNVPACAPGSASMGSALLALPVDLPAASGYVLVATVMPASAQSMPFPLGPLAILPANGGSSGSASLRFLNVVPTTTVTAGAPFYVAWAAVGLDCMSTASAGSRLALMAVRADAQMGSSSAMPLTLLADAPACTAANPDGGRVAVSFPPDMPPAQVFMGLVVTAGKGAQMVNATVGPVIVLAMPPPANTTGGNGTNAMPPRVAIVAPGPGAMALQETDIPVSFVVQGSACKSDRLSAGVWTPNGDMLGALVMRDACDGSGMLSLRIPLSAGGSAIIMVSLWAADGVTLKANASVPVQSVRPLLEITGPSAGTRFAAGSLVTVMWRQAFLAASDMVNMTVSRPSRPGWTWVAGIFPATDARGTFMVPLDAAASDDYVIRITLLRVPALLANSPAYSVVGGASVGPVWLNNPMTGAQIVDMLPQGAAVRVSWGLPGVPPNMDQAVWLCASMPLAAFNGMPCRRVAAVPTPVNSTVFAVPWDVPLSSAGTYYRINVTAYLSSPTGPTRELSAATNTLAITAGSADSARLAVVDPVMPMTLAVGSMLNLSWVTVGLPESAPLNISIWPVGAAAPLPIFLSTVPAASFGGCTPDARCSGQRRFGAIPPELLPQGVPYGVFVACAAVFGAPSVRDCSAPVTVFARQDPMLKAMIAWPMTLATGTDALPVAKVGSALEVRWSYAALQGNVSVWLVAADGSTAPMRLQPWQVPVERSGAVVMLPPVNVSAAGSLFSLRVTSLSTGISADTGFFNVVPALGSLSVRYPVAGAVFTVGQRTSVAWAALGVDGTVVIDLMSPTGARVAGLGSAPASVGYFVTDALSDGVVPATLASAMFMLRLTASPSGGVAPVVAMSDAFTIQRPSMGFTALALLDAAGAPVMNASVGAPVRAVWTSFGFPSTTTVMVGIMMADGSGSGPVAYAAQAAPISGDVSFALPTSLKEGAYRLAIMPNGFNAAPFTSPRTFNVMPPRGGLVAKLVGSSSSSVATVGGSVWVEWMTYSAGAVVTDAGGYTIALSNMYLPSTWMMNVATDADASGNASVPLPASLDLSPGVASAYFVRVWRNSGGLSAQTGTFTVTAPRAYLTVKSPAAGARYTAGASLQVSWDDGSTLSSLSAGARVNITLRNPFYPEGFFPSQQADASAGGVGVTIAIRSDFRPVAGSEGAFIVVVRSVDFPSVAAASPAFTVLAATPPASLMITSLGGSANAAAATTTTVSADGSTLASTVLQETDMPTLTWRAVSAAPFSLNIRLCNARSADPCKSLVNPPLAASAQAYTLTAGQLAGFAGAAAPGARDAFFYSFECVSATTVCPSAMSVRSPFFTIFAASNASAATAVVRILSPQQPMSVVAGDALSVAWASIGLPASAQVTLELVNDLLGYTATLQDGQPASGYYVAKLPADAPANSSVRSAFFVRVRASATVFAVSPLLTILPPAVAGGVQLQIAAPTAGTAVLVGQTLDVAWRSFPETDYNVNLWLVNSGDASIGVLIADSVAASARRFSWVVPATVPTALALRRLYQVRLDVRPSSASSSSAAVGTFSSPLFTVATMDAVVGVSAPAAGAAFTIGDALAVTFNARGAKGPFRVALVNPASGFLRTLDYNASVAVDPATGAASGSLSWRIPGDTPVSPAARSSWYVTVTAGDASNAAGRAGPFSISPLASPYTILAPSVGLVANNGTQIKVAFALSADAASTSGASAVNITLRSRLSTAEVRLASGVTAASGLYVLPADLPVDGAVRDAYYVRVGPAMPGTGFLPADSDLFTITAGANSLRVTSPLVGTSLTRGDRLQVRWTASKGLAGSTVRVELINPLQQSRVFLAYAAVDAGSDAAAADAGGMPAGSISGSLTTMIPASVILPQSADARAAFAVRVTSAADGSVTDDSAAFTITPPTQSIRVLRPSPDSGAPMAGSTVEVAWVAVGVMGDARLSIYMRNTSFTADDSRGYAATTAAAAGSAAACAMLLSAASMPAGAVCGRMNVTVPSSASDPSVWGRPTVWALRIRSSEDATVFGESALFVVRPAMAPLAATITAVGTALTDGKYVAGSAMDIAWTFASGTPATAVRVELRCAAAGAGEVVLDVISQSVALTDGALAGYSLPLARLGTMEAAAYCFVQLTAAGGAVAGSVRSRMFSVVLPALGVQLLQPAGLRTSAIATTPATMLSGAALDVSWAYTPAGLQVGRLDVVLLRLGGAAGSDTATVLFSSAAVPAANGSAVAAAKTLSTAIPGTLPLGTYAVQVTVGVAGTSRVGIDRSAPFLVRPKDPKLEALKPAAGASVMAGALLEFAYRSTGIAASNRVRIGIREPGADVSTAIVVTPGAEATGVFRWAVPPMLLPASVAAKSFVARVELLEDPSIFAETAAFSIANNPSFVAVTSPALGPNRAVPTWRAGDGVAVNFTLSGFRNVSTVRVELWQDRFFLAGGDALLATLGSAVPVEAGSIGWTVPADIDSSMQVFVKVTANVPVSSSAAGTLLVKNSGRSASFNIRSARVPGFKTLLDNLNCAALTASPPTTPAHLAAVKAVCASTCDACIAWGGRWMPAAGLALDFDLPGWAGGQLDLALFKNALGAFVATGVNLCWPAEQLNVTATGGGGFRLRIPGVPAYNTTVVAASNGFLMNPVLRLSASGVANVLDTCAAIRPAVTGSTALQNLDPATLTPDQIAGLAADLKAKLAALLAAQGVSSQDVSVSLNGGSAATSGASTTTSVSASTARRLQSDGSSTSTSATFVINTNDDGSAQAASDALATSTVTATSGSVTATTGAASAVAVPASAQTSSDASSGSTAPAFGVTTSDGGSTRAVTSVGDADLSASAFSASTGYYSALVANAATRDTGTAAVSSGATPTPAPGAAGSSSGASADKSTVLIGAIVGALAGVGLVAFLAYVVYQRNTAAKGKGKGKGKGASAASGGFAGGGVAGGHDMVSMANPIARHNRTEIAPTGMGSSV